GGAQALWRALHRPVPGADGRVASAGALARGGARPAAPGGRLPRAPHRGPPAGADAPGRRPAPHGREERPLEDRSRLRRRGVSAPAAAPAAEREAAVPDVRPAAADRPRRWPTALGLL